MSVSEYSVGAGAYIYKIIYQNFPFDFFLRPIYKSVAGEK